MKNLRKKSKYLQKELHKLGIQSSVSSAKWDYYQALTSRGDENLTDYLIEVYRLGGKLGAYKKQQKRSILIQIIMQYRTMIMKNTSLEFY